MNNIGFTPNAYLIDAFTQQQFAGNQAAVVILNEYKTDEWLQAVAAEFNLSETAFLQCIDQNRWHLRWFTPICEIKLCGHATLASAHVLINELKIGYEQIVFSTLSGDLTAELQQGKIKLDFPRTAISLLTSLDSAILSISQGALAVYRAGEDMIIEFAREESVRDYRAIRERITAIETRGIIITAPANPNEHGIDFVSRFFAPRIGIDEDPVTGSAHCALASLWSEKLHKKTLRAKQLSARTGLLDVVCEPTRVGLRGDCVTFLRGVI